MSEVPFDRYRRGGRELLGPPPPGDETSRHGYGVRVLEECGAACVYCGRDLGGPYESRLDFSVDHVVPTNTIGCGYPKDWVDDLLNLVACCRHCNEFLNRYEVDEPPLDGLEAFCALRDRVFLDKRKRTGVRHEQERAYYDAWRARRLSGG